MVLLSQLSSQADEHYDGSGAFYGTSRSELLHHLDQRHSVVHPHLEEEANRMVLGHCRVVDGQLSAGGRKAKGETA
jgi:hypothetical protein